VDRAFPLQQLLDQVAADKARRTRDEVAHLLRSITRWNLHRP
jgi:hypothetical protein